MTTTGYGDIPVSAVREESAESTLSDAQRRLIREAAELRDYVENPVPSGLMEDIDADLRSFVRFPAVSVSRLQGIYPDGCDPIAMVSEDWREAFNAGALRMYGDCSIDFPVRFLKRNGRVAEAAIKRDGGEGDTRGSGMNWFFNYVPEPDSLSTRPISDPSDSPELFGEAVEPPMPASLPDAMRAVLDAPDYSDGRLLEERLAELEGWPDFSNFAYVGSRWRDELCTLAGIEFDTLSFLDREWSAALSAGAVREYEEKLIFPVSLFRADGETLVEVAIRRDRKDDGTGRFLPWFVTWVESGPKRGANPARELERWAIFDWGNLLERVAGMALPEQWDLIGSDGRQRPYALLKNYIEYTFYRLKRQGKVLENQKREMAAFNTGLVTNTYESIYACFTPAHSDKDWRFAGICKAGSRGLGKELVRAFNPLPKRASYFDRKEDLLYNTECDLILDYDHILLDRIHRLPAAFLREELRGNGDAIELLESFYGAVGEERDGLLEELRAVVSDDDRLMRRLINRLNDAKDVAIKRVEWNFKAAVPAFYPTSDTMSLLLPLDLTEDGNPDVALVVECTDNGCYLGQTILTMEMAYKNARLVCRPDSDWLNHGAL